jgi:hypothetical protein
MVVIGTGGRVGVLVKVGVGAGVRLVGAIASAAIPMQ